MDSFEMIESAVNLYNNNLYVAAYLKNTNFLDIFKSDLNDFLSHIESKDHLNMHRIYVNKSPITKILLNKDYNNIIYNILGINNRNYKQSNFIFNCCEKLNIPIIDQKFIEKRIQIFLKYYNKEKITNIKKFVADRKCYFNKFSNGVVCPFLENKKYKNDSNIYLLTEYISAYKEKKKLDNVGLGNYFYFVSEEQDFVGYDLLSYDQEAKKEKAIDAKSSEDGSIYISDDEYEELKNPFLNVKYDYYIHYYYTHDIHDVMVFEFKYDRKNDCFFNTMNPNMRYGITPDSKTGEYSFFFDEVYNPNCSCYIDRFDLMNRVCEIIDEQQNTVGQTYRNIKIRI